jgi:PAS domain S-box-containing protein
MNPRFDAHSEHPETPAPGLRPIPAAKTHNLNVVPASSPLRILVIDDNAAIHDDFRKIFSSEDATQTDLDSATAALFGGETESARHTDFEVDSAYQGREGLQMVKQALLQGRPYALAFVDVRMPPGWDGIETIQHVWRSYPSLQVVICTAYSDYSWSQITRQIGCNDNLVILKKPFDNIEVLQLANALTRKWVLAQQAKCQLDGLDRIVQQRTAELHDANQTLLKEIAERKLIENALRLSEERFSKAFRASPIPMAIEVLPGGQFVDANDALLRMTGYAREDWNGSSPDKLCLFAEADFHTRLVSALRGGQPVRQTPSNIHTRSGQKRDTLISMELLDLGDQPHLLLIAEDVTERTALEQELRQAQKVEAIGQLAAGVAHDFNNILTVIHGHASLSLAVANLNTQVTDSLRQISSAADRAAGLTRQLLAFSRKQTIQRRVFDINEVLANLHKMLGRLIGEHITLSCNFHPLPLRVSADIGCVEQVMINLAVNARDAMLEGGELKISTSPVTTDDQILRRNPEVQAGPYARVSVQDTGCGMTPDVLARIFEPFFTTKEVGKGTGLGLATVYGILKQHGGWIEVNSVPGKGSTFHFYLPLTALPAPDSSPVAAAKTLPRGHETILVVEDEQSLREMTAKILRGQGHTVHTAASGPQALKVWKSQQGKFDLLLTDVVMPEAVSGVALSETLRGEAPGLRVVYMSGYSLDFAGKDLSKLKGLCFLQKPFNQAQLLEIIRASLDSPPSSDNSP